MIARDRNADGNGATGTAGLEERVYALQDSNWNTTAIIAASGVAGFATGSVINRFVYTPYGEAETLTASWAAAPTGSAVPWSHLFQGLKLTEITSLFYVRNRDYSASLGRFIERDPIGFNAGDNNWYRFVGNKPSGKTDPSGLLEPNIGQGIGTYHYTYHSIEFRAGSAAGCDKLQEKIYDDLKLFKFFDGHHNWDAKVRRDGNNAYFDSLYMFGFLSDSINPKEVPVSLAFVDQLFLVEATTLVGHMLDGKRYWSVVVGDGPFCQCDVTVLTWAYERIVGLANTVGQTVTAALWDSQMQVWDGYLMNIAEAYTGPGGVLRSPITGNPYVYHTERETGLTKIPESPR
jgi:RHS repeat-associated protein